MNRAVTTIFRRLGNLEKEVQQLKIEAYFSLPKKQQISQIYPESGIMKALKSTRRSIWQKRYAKKIKSVS